MHLHASHFASRSAPPQEQSRYSESAAPAKDFAWRSAPCSMDHQRGFLAEIPCLRSGRPGRTDILVDSCWLRLACPKRAAASFAPPLAASSCVWTGRRSRRPWLKSGCSVRSLGSVCRACAPGRAGIRGLAASWLFSSRRQAHFLLAHHRRILCCLTFELRRDQQQNARPAMRMIACAASRAWRFDVGPRLERGVRQHSARYEDRPDFSCKPFCYPLRATARAVAVLRVCGAYQGLCMALCALQLGPRVWVLRRDSPPALTTLRLA